MAHFPGTQCWHHQLEQQLLPQCSQRPSGPSVWKQRIPWNFIRMPYFLRNEISRWPPWVGWYLSLRVSAPKHVFFWRWFAVQCSCGAREMMRTKASQALPNQIKISQKLSEIVTIYLWYLTFCTKNGETLVVPLPPSKSKGPQSEHATAMGIAINLWKAGKSIAAGSFGEKSISILC